MINASIQLPITFHLTLRDRNSVEIYLDGNKVGDWSTENGIVMPSTSILIGQPIDTIIELANCCIRLREVLNK